MTMDGKKKRVKSDKLMTKAIVVGNNNKRAYLWLLRKGLSSPIVLTTKCLSSFPRLTSGWKVSGIQRN